MTSKLKELIARAESWPEEAQEELVQLGLDIEAERDAKLVLSAEDIAALERSADDVRQGRFAGDDRVRKVLDRPRRA